VTRPGRARSAGPRSAGHGTPTPGQSSGPSSPDVVPSPRSPDAVLRGEFAERLSCECLGGAKSSSAYSTGPLFAICKHPASPCSASAALPQSSSRAGVGAAEPPFMGSASHHGLSADTCSTQLPPCHGGEQKLLWATPGACSGGQPTPRAAMCPERGRGRVGTSTSTSAGSLPRAGAGAWGGRGRAPGRRPEQRGCQPTAAPLHPS